MSGDARWGWVREEACRGFSHSLCTLAMSKYMEMPCEGGRWGMEKRVSDGPVTGKTSSELNEIGRKSLSPPEEAAICGCSLLWKVPSVL